MWESSSAWGSIAFERARTHLDLARIAHTQNNRELATTHLSTAYTWFKQLQASTYVARMAKLAQTYGIALQNVQLETIDGV